LTGRYQEAVSFEHDGSGAEPLRMPEWLLEP
jgi:hypothetical protein